MKKGIAFFDFDGTITTKDTLLEFIRFSKGNAAFYLGFLLYSPYLVAMKLKLLSNQVAKEKVLRFFFRGTPAAGFAAQCAAFTQAVLPRLIRPKALEEIARLKAQRYLVVIVSASPEAWIRPWAEAMQTELIASRLEVEEGKLTGKIVGKNCHGEEKVRRILEQHAVKDYDEIYAYGDSSGDRQMLELATHPFFRPFRQ